MPKPYRSRPGRDVGRDSGGFMALPWSVLDSHAYMQLSHPARSLLLEIGRQFVRDNNGQLLASRAYLAGRGWKSAAVIDRAKHELLAARFIFETVKGCRPNKASWYAVTWRTLDPHPAYDPGAAATFQRGAYRLSEPLKNASLSPPRGTDRPAIGPSRGTEEGAAVPREGPMKAVLGPRSVPSGGHLLDMPSACAPSKKERGSPAGESAPETAGALG